MNNRKNFGSLLVPIALVAGLIGGIFIGKYSSTTTLTPQESKIRNILELVKQQYVDNINTDSLLDATIPYLLTGLDPHSVYIPKSELQLANDDLESSFGGVGVMFQIINDSVNVIEVVAGGPAEKVGMKPGDIILHANGKKLSGAGVSSNDVFSTLRGEEGSNVKLTVKRRNSSKPLTFDITRGKIPSESVDVSYMAADGVGYIRVSKFARNTYNEFMDALLKLSNEGAERFVIDLRDNSGGFMDQAILMANEFLPVGRTIVYTKGRTPENEFSAVSDGAGEFQDKEITILVNEYSASASEIFAGAIQDNDRGLVIGRRTFGKGLVQNQFELPDSSAIRLTVARYYTPTGRSIQKDYVRGIDGQYQLDILDRYNHGEFYSEDSIKLDKSKKFKTVGGRTVYGGGGIMPDVFVANDTTGITNYYIEAVNRGLIQKFAQNMAETYRPMMKGSKSMDVLKRVMARDNTLLNTFVNFASANGLPARWYYINKSKDLIINQIKAYIARDLVGYDEFIKILNTKDKTVNKAVQELKDGKSPTVLK